MLNFKKRKKITLSNTGELMYPHDFIVGQMIRYKDDFRYLDKPDYHGSGIITEINHSVVTVFWQTRLEYSTYLCVDASLYFEIML